MRQGIPRGRDRPPLPTHRVTESLGKALNRLQPMSSSVVTPARRVIAESSNLFLLLLAGTSYSVEPWTLRGRSVRSRRSTATRYLMAWKALESLRILRYNASWPKEHHFLPPSVLPCKSHYRLMIFQREWPNDCFSQFENPSFNQSNSLHNVLATLGKLAAQS